MCSEYKKYVCCIYMVNVFLGAHLNCMCVRVPACVCMCVGVFVQLLVFLCVLVQLDVCHTCFKKENKEENLIFWMEYCHHLNSKYLKIDLK